MYIGKTQSVIFMIERLDTRGFFSKEEVQNELELSDDQFHRYVAEIKNYYLVVHPELDLIYDKREGVYRKTIFQPIFK